MTRTHEAVACVVVLLLSGAAQDVQAENWPGFRGPTGQGISAEKGLPTRWGEKENIAWKATIEGEGWSSPVVWGDRVFLTATRDSGTSCRVICVHRVSGKVLWDREVYKQKPTRKESRNSFATPTPAVDGKRVYAVFADGGMAALDHDGKVIWINQDVKFYSQHGLGASPLRYGDLLIMPFDGSSSGADKGLGWQRPWEKSFLLAVDASTGKQRWRAGRGPSRIAHTTPVVFKVGGRDQIISSAGDVVQGFDPADGKRLWSVRSEGEGVVPSPVCGEGLVFAASGFGDPAVRAVRPATRDKPAAVVWEEKGSVPMIPSLLFARGHLFTLTQDGVLQCLEGSSGKVVWKQRLQGSYAASPLWAAGKLYLLSESGVTTVVEAGAKYQQVAKNPIGEPAKASLAPSGGQLFLRTEKHLFCIGKPAKKE